MIQVQILDKKSKVRRFGLSPSSGMVGRIVKIQK